MDRQGKNYIYDESTLKSIQSHSSRYRRSFIKETVSNGFPIRVLVPDVNKWLVEPVRWTQKKKEFVKYVEDRITENKDVTNIRFGTNVDVKKSDISRMRIPLKWEDLEGIGHDGNHIVQNFIGRLISKLTGNTRQYSYLDYRLFAASLFVDPPGTSEQQFHEDLYGLDRLAFWNIMIPIQLPKDQTPKNTAFAIAQSILRHREHMTQTINDAVAWDANWMHRGLGNPSKYKNFVEGTRIQLHLICAPCFLLVPVCQSLTEHNKLDLKQCQDSLVGDVLNKTVQGVNVYTIIHAQN